MMWKRKSKEQKLLDAIKKIEFNLAKQEKVVGRYLDPLFKEPYINDKIVRAILHIREQTIIMVGLIEHAIKNGNK